MPLPYTGVGGIPCYHTAPFDRYGSGLQTLFYDLVSRCQARSIPEPDEPLQGSYSAVAPFAANKRAAKLVMYERNQGNWVLRTQPNPAWLDGLYIWVRANDEPGDLLEQAIQETSFMAKHQGVLSRLEMNGSNYRVISVDPNPLEHFAFLHFDPSRDDRDRIVDLIEACSRLSPP